MPQTQEDRIFLHFRALKRRIDWGEHGYPYIYMNLARRWKRSIKEIKAIIAGKKSE